MHATCAAQFAGSHLCHAAEYELATPATPAPAVGAWVDGSAVSGDTQYFTTGALAAINAGRYATSDSLWNCQNWTSSAGSATGAVILPSGWTTLACNVARPLACCVTPYRESFQGTFGATTGSAGGRQAMHAICAAQAAGSHMCHAAEYYRTGNATALPATGAWVDGSAFMGATQYFTTGALAAVNVGRYASGDSLWNCQNWTSLAASATGAVITPSGWTTLACNVTRPVACCR
jgi:hypothetical protein